MTDLFFPPCTEEVFPREVLRYNFVTGMYISLNQLGAEDWRIVDCDGVILADCIYTWSHASDSWDLCKPTTV